MSGAENTAPREIAGTNVPNATLPPVDLVIIAKVNAGEVAERGLEAVARELLPALRTGVDRVMRKVRDKDGGR